MREPGATRGALPVEIEGPTTYSSKATQNGITRVDHHREGKVLFGPADVTAMDTANKAPVIQLKETKTNLVYDSSVGSRVREEVNGCKEQLLKRENLEHREKETNDLRLSSLGAAMIPT